MSETTLPANLVIGGLWPGAPVRATKHTGEVVDGVIVERILSGTGWRVCGHGIIEAIAHDEAPTVWVLDLRLPGPLGLGIAGIVERSRKRLLPTSPCLEWMPKWLMDEGDRFGWGVRDPRGATLVSRYLVYTDGLASARGWPVGPGAPVYGWRRHTSRSWTLTGASVLDVEMYYKGDSLTDPMSALEAVWRSECAP